MRKIRNILIVVLILLGFSTTANALQYGYGYSEVDLTSFNYTVGQNSTPFYARDLGWYSSGYALALDQDQIDPTGFPETNLDTVLEIWATALTTDAFADARTYNGTTSSTVEAVAGYDFSTGTNHGAFSLAQAGTFVSAYEFYAPNGGDISFNINYSLLSAIYGDEPGFSFAGAGAMLAIYQEGLNGDQGHWLDLAGIYGLDEEEGTLSVVLEGLEAGSMFSVFSGTTAWAMAYAPGGDTAPVPEPATMLLLGTGLIGIASVSRRKLIKK